MFMDVCWIVGVLVAVILTGEYVWLCVCSGVEGEYVCDGVCVCVVVLVYGVYECMGIYDMSVWVYGHMIYECMTVSVWV